MPATAPKVFDVYGTPLAVGDWAVVVKNAYGVYWDTIFPARQIATIERRTVHGQSVLRLRFRGDPTNFGRVPTHLMKANLEVAKPKRESKGFAAFVKRIEK